MRGHRLLGAGLILLGAVVAATAVLGPLVTGVLRYHTSGTTLNQVMGGDAAALAVVAPYCLVVGVLSLRGHPAAPVLALPPAVFAVYTFTQLIVGQEYLRLPGNSERYFPLLFSGFLVGGLIAVTAWRTIDAPRLPAMSRRLDRLAAGVLFAVAFFLVLQHMPSLADALRDTPTRAEYVSSPTPFWLVKLMDLGIVVPAAIAAGVGAARGAAWARTPVYAIVGAYTLLGASVAGMGITMYVNNDPDASLAVAAGFTLFALVFAWLSFVVYRPLFRPGHSGSQRTLLQRAR
ncbi:hypothetical protein [Dactylosporangium sp. NPDC048998]|uniref:hypothetical protein n=1 Tax=Dactylosporangium sp. NPDC048998 TaxID=3363976 RepID=UPI0037114482